MFGIGEEVLHWRIGVISELLGEWHWRFKSGQEQLTTPTDDYHPNLNTKEIKFATDILELPPGKRKRARSKRCGLCVCSLCVLMDRKEG